MKNVIGNFTGIALGHFDSIDSYKNPSIWIVVPCLVAQLCPTLCDPVECSSPGSSVHGDSPGKNIGMGCHALLQGIFPNQVLKLHVLH